VRSICRHVLGWAVLLGLAMAPQAQERNWYSSVRGGVSFLDDMNFSQPGYRGMAEFDSGVLLPGSLSRYLDRFRGGVELDYSRSDLYRVSEFGVGVPAGGDVSADTVMATGYYDFDAGTKWSSYIGGGIGGANVSLSDLSAPGVHLADDYETVLAYQIRAGFAYRFSDTLDWTLGYRFFATEDLDFRGSSGTAFSLGGPQEHNFEIGVRLRF